MIIGSLQEVKLYVKPRDSTTGEVEFMARQKAVDSSRKIIIVLSNSYICSASCLEDATILLGTVDSRSQILPVISDIHQCHHIHRDVMQDRRRCQTRSTSLTE